jgi:hypothetical protein
MDRPKQTGNDESAAENAGMASDGVARTELQQYDSGCAYQKRFHYVRRIVNNEMSIRRLIYLLEQQKN